MEDETYNRYKPGTPMVLAIFFFFYFSNNFMYSFYYCLSIVHIFFFLLFNLGYILLESFLKRNKFLNCMSIKNWLNKYGFNQTGIECTTANAYQKPCCSKTSKNPRIKFFYVQKERKLLTNMRINLKYHWMYKRIIIITYLYLKN